MSLRAFTLSETIITLTIIGIVAALTLPNLINNIQDMQYAAMWKKKYAEITEIYEKTKDETGLQVCVLLNTAEEHMAGYGDIAGQISTCSTPNKSYYSRYATLSPEFVEKFVSNLKVVDSCGKAEYGESKDCSNNGLQGSVSWSGLCSCGIDYGCHLSYYGSLRDGKGAEPPKSASCRRTPNGIDAHDLSNKAVLLADGSVIYFGGYATGIITVDVNGFAKGPNAIGRDVFAVMVTENWIRPFGADDTYKTSGTTGHEAGISGDIEGVTTGNCKCSKDWGGGKSQGFLGSGDLLHGPLISGACCSYTKIHK